MSYTRVLGWSLFTLWDIRLCAPLRGLSSSIKRYKWNLLNFGQKHGTVQLLSILSLGCSFCLFLRKEPIRSSFTILIPSLVSKTTLIYTSSMPSPVLSWMRLKQIWFCLAERIFRSISLKQDRSKANSEKNVKVLKLIVFSTIATINRWLLGWTKRSLFVGKLRNIILTSAIKSTSFWSKISPAS